LIAKAVSKIDASYMI